jgi:membrane-associated phospholipid phosphatase
MRRFVYLFLLGALCFPVEATCPNKRPTPITNTGKKLYPLATTGVALLKRDWIGAVTSIALVQTLYSTNGLLEFRIGKKRPCGCDGAFPSGHMIMMSTSSSFLFFRYGWRWGLPPMIGAFLLMADRVNAKAHGWDDVTGTALLYHLISWLFVARRGQRWRDKWRRFLTIFQRSPKALDPA